jgi:hypothetical protein
LQALDANHKLSQSINFLDFSDNNLGKSGEVFAEWLDNMSILGEGGVYVNSSDLRHLNLASEKIFFF